MKKALRILGVVATIGMFFVLVTGATVTTTGSEHGCGRSWPLCHGKLIPQMAVSTAIEWSHRADAAIETSLILPLAIGVFLLYRRRDLRILAATMVFFIFLQAGLGAWAVMFPQEAAILAIHFGVSLTAFASVLLTAALLFEMDTIGTLRRKPVPVSLRWFAWGLAVYSYAVIYLGAYVRHAKADDACRGWPLCNGTLVPHLGGLVTANFVHRLAAGLLSIAILALVLWSARFRDTRPDVFRASAIALFMVILQAASGAVVVLTDVDIFSALAHAALAGCMFGSLSYLCLHLLPSHGRAAEEDRRSVIGGAPVAAGQ